MIFLLRGNGVIQSICEQLEFCEKGGDVIIVELGMNGHCATMMWNEMISVSSFFFILD